MDRQKVLAKLLWDLQSFLSVLDSENLSFIAQAQKKSISELLARLQGPDAPVEDAEYMIMTCTPPSPGNNITDSPGTEDVVPVSQQESRKGSQGPEVPPQPQGGLDSIDDDDDEDTYEEAEPFIPEGSTTTTERRESDSSHYESYGEEDEGEGFVKDRAHYIQWSASQPCLRPAPESRLCGYLWRKKWLGQWSKQLFVIRNNTLLCYKCAKDLSPQMEVCLSGCTVAYKAKHSSKMQHELKVTAGSETLVLGFNSCQQADEWRKALEEVGGSVYCELETSSSLLKSEPLLCSRSSMVLQSDSDEENPSAVHCVENNEKGFLNVLMNCQWQNLLCQVEAGLLKMFGEEGEERGGGERPPQYTVQLRGCEVKSGPDTSYAYRISLTQHGDQLAVLEVSCSNEKERWLQLLQDAAVNQNHSGNKSTVENTARGLSGLQTRRFPTSNMYMDDPFQLNGTNQQPIYSNASILEHMFKDSQADQRSDSISSRDSVTYTNTIFTKHSKAGCDVQRSVQKLELTGRQRLHLRTGSEMNLASTSKQNKRTSFRQSLAFCTERAQAGFLSPLLRRTASAKTSLTKAPSALFIEHGRVLQRRKEWETKTAT